MVENVGDIKSEDILQALVDTVKVKRESMDSVLDQMEIDRMLQYIGDVGFSVLRKMKVFNGSAAASFDDFWTRYIVTSPSPIPPTHSGSGRPSAYDRAIPSVPCSVLLGQFNACMGRQGIDPISPQRFNHVIAGKGVNSGKQSGTRNYIGIRLRTTADRIPEFDDEVASPDCVKELGHALLMSTRDNITVDPCKEERVRIWTAANILWTRSVYNIIRLDLVYRLFREDEEDISIDEFRRSLETSFISVPDSLRWTDRRVGIQEDPSVRSIRWMPATLKKIHRGYGLPAPPQ